MAQKLDHKCIICGTMYHACDTCQKIKTYTPWRTLCDTQEHYQVLLDIRSYDSGILTREEAAADIMKRGVKRGCYDEWPDATKRKLDEILAEPKKKKKVEIIQPVQEPIDVWEPIEDVAVADKNL